MCLTLKLKTRVGAQAEGDKIEWTEKKKLSYVVTFKCCNLVA